MKNMIKYIKKYGNTTFKEKQITDIDILIFSLIPYIDFKEEFKINKDGLTLKQAWEKVKEYNKKPKCFIQKTAFKVMEELCDKERYKDIILKNYTYYLSDITQFGAITIDTENHTYVVFEGTDDDMSGWKEDFQLTYIYPTESQKMATKYLNNAIKNSKYSVTVCGHSKGGNLALVSSMNVSFFEKKKIKKIYSFDGPGLKEEEFKSIKYKLIRKKLINIIPNLSLVGILLKQENLNVVKSKGIGIFQHDPITWVIEDDKLKPDEQENLSKKFDISITRWLSKYNYKERKEIVEGIFSILESADIKKLSDIKMNKLQSLYKIIKASQNISIETKEVIITSLKLLATDLKGEIGNKTIE